MGGRNLSSKKPKVVARVYLVESTPHGEFYERIGVFTSYEKAKKAADEWWKVHKEHLSEAYYPSIEELEVIE